MSCSKAPEPLWRQAHASPTPTEIVNQAAGTSLAAEAETPAAESFPTPTAAPTAAAQYRNPETQAAVDEYSHAWQQFKADGEAGATLGEIDPLTNPGAIVDYANKIGTDTNQLDQAERAAKGTMNPEEKKRFKAYQKELMQPETD